MRKILITAALLAALGVKAQLKMPDVFRAMPDTLVPYLTENNRLDCIDFKEANMKAEVRNALDGKSELVTLNDQYACLALNEAHRMELRLLDVAEAVDSCRQILCIVDTYGKDFKESVVSFRSLTWRKLDTAAYLSISGGQQSAAAVAGVSGLPVAPFVATLDEHHPVLTVTPSDYQERPATEDQQPLDILPTNLKWDNISFK